MPLKDPVKRAEYNRRWRERHKDRLKEYRRNKRRTERLQQYNLTLEEYSKLLKSQGHKCKCCGTHKKKVKYNLAVDHCHESGEVRGLICSKCNVGIGMLGDSLEGLRKAIEYLESHYEPPKKRKPKHQSVRDRPDKEVRGLSPKTAGRQMSGVSRQARRKEVLVAGI